MLLAERGYDADSIRALVNQQGACANIPHKKGYSDLPEIDHPCHRDIYHGGLEQPFLAQPDKRIAASNFGLLWIGKFT